MKDLSVTYMKKAVQVLLAIGGIIGGVLGSIQLYEYFAKEKIVVYKEPYIPLVYVGAKEFRGFLDENKNRKVQFDTQISFDAVLGVSMLIHEVCNYDGVLETIRDNPENISSTDIGLIRFKEGFTDPQNKYIYNNETGGYDFPPASINNVWCGDRLRILVKDPKRLRLSFGGTGTISLPISGLFVIEPRYFSGPSIEYTLREL